MFEVKRTKEEESRLAGLKNVIANKSYQKFL